MSHRLRITTRASILLLACGVSGLHAGEIYKTVDANGTVIYSDHADPNAAQTSVVELQDPRYPPHEMHVCWVNCFTLIYDGGVYRRSDGTNDSWTVTKFTADSLILHRHSVPAKWNGFSDDVTYEGHISHDRLVGVSLNGTPTSGIDASWGTALNTLPGSNAERDARQANGWTPEASRDFARDDAVSVAVAPPPIPEDLQPEVPQDGYLWTPGFWSWGGDAYVWVPGSWVQPPAVGLLWTPGYWRFVASRYCFHPGYWGPHVGFYGGVNYGFGYFGNGYAGGHWVGNSFAYNSSVNHVNAKVIRNTYAEVVARPAGRSFVSYNGGPGGTAAVATEPERLAATEARAPAGAPQVRTPARAGAAPTPIRVVPTVRAVPTPVRTSNVVQQHAEVVRTPAEPQDQPSRPATPSRTSAPAPHVSRPAAPKGLPKL